MGWCQSCPSHDMTVDKRYLTLTLPELSLFALSNGDKLPHGRFGFSLVRYGRFDNTVASSLASFGMS
jgi:hypothetical protein